MSINIGAFRSQNDINDKLRKYKELLDLQSKLQRQQEEKNKMAFKGGVPVELQPTSIGRYGSTEEELADYNRQQQLMLQTLQGLFKYPNEAKNTLDIFLEQGNNASDFNRLQGDFLETIKKVGSLTPSFFMSNWDKFITKYQSQGDSLVSVGIMDDRTRYFLQQDANKIKKFMNQYGGLSAPQKNRLSRVLETQIFNVGSEPEGRTLFQDYSNAIDLATKGRLVEGELQTLPPTEVVDMISKAFSLQAPVSAKEKLKRVKETIFRKEEKALEEKIKPAVQRELEATSSKIKKLESDIASAEEREDWGGAKKKQEKLLKQLKNDMNLIGIRVRQIIEQEASARSGEEVKLSDEEVSRAVEEQLASEKPSVVKKLISETSVIAKKIKQVEAQMEKAPMKRKQKTIKQLEESKRIAEKKGTILTGISEAISKRTTKVPKEELLFGTPRGSSRKSSEPMFEPMFGMEEEKEPVIKTPSSPKTVREATNYIRNFPTEKVGKTNALHYVFTGDAGEKAMQRVRLFTALLISNGMSPEDARSEALQSQIASKEDPFQINRLTAVKSFNSKAQLKSLPNIPVIKELRSKPKSIPMSGSGMKLNKKIISKCK